MNLKKALEARVADAMKAAGAPEDAPALVTTSAQPQFGDYQANGCMSAAKTLKTNPRKLAEKVVGELDLSDLADKVEVAGPGFINITLKDEFLAQRVAEALRDEKHLGTPLAASPQTVVVDYSSPNLAKEMHVGHLRSTIIGDALARTLEFLGHHVIRQNHVGDWGTQFGMLAYYLDDKNMPATAPRELEILDMEEFYREAKKLFDDNDGNNEFARRSREYVVELQSGDKHVNFNWRSIVGQSLSHCQQVYNRLGVRLSSDDVRGESAYNDDLPKVIANLKDAGLLTESQGAQCVFLDEFTNKDGQPLPVIVQKSDGGYLYATTDLAAMRYRVGELHADRILYVTDSRQGLHFRQVFAVARKAGFVPEGVSLEHVAFGMMLGDAGQPFQTREGGTVKLMDLLDEAEKRAFELVSEKNPDLDDERRRDIARAVGIGAVKYADLSQNRASDYVFSWDKMLSLDGNTAPYMQYAYARIRSIFRKSGGTSVPPVEGSTGVPPVEGGEFIISDPAERTLAVKLLQFPETVETLATECLPNILCGYLFDLAGAFMGFYENCPVLKAPDAATRAGRLSLCELTARTIKKGLDLLGIETIERM